MSSGPGAGRQLERAAADHVLQARLRVAAAELERGAHRVAHRQTQEGAERPVTDAVRVLRWNRRRPRRTVRHVVFLVPGFEGSGPDLSHAANRFVRALAQLHQQPGGDGPGAPQTAAAVDEHVEAQAQPVPEGFPHVVPFFLEGPCRRRLPILDWQVPPLQVPVEDGLPEIRDLQIVDLPVGDQGYHRGRPPALNRVEVGVEVTLPGPCHPAGILLAGAERDADPAVSVRRGDGGNAQRAALAGLRCRHGLPSFNASPLDAAGRFQDSCREVRHSPCRTAESCDSLAR